MMGENRQSLSKILLCHDTTSSRRSFGNNVLHGSQVSSFLPNWSCARCTLSAAQPCVKHWITSHRKDCYTVFRAKGHSSHRQSCANDLYTRRLVFLKIWRHVVSPSAHRYSNKQLHQPASS